MGTSIQDYLKKINSRVTIIDILSILLSTLILIGFLFYIQDKTSNFKIPVSYIKK